MLFRVRGDGGGEVRGCVETVQCRGGGCGAWLGSVVGRFRLVEQGGEFVSEGDCSVWFPWSCQISEINQLQKRRRGHTLLSTTGEDGLGELSLRQLAVYQEVLDNLAGSHDDALGLGLDVEREELAEDYAALVRSKEDVVLALTLTRGLPSLAVLILLPRLEIPRDDGLEDWSGDGDLVPARERLFLSDFSVAYAAGLWVQWVRQENL